MGTADRIFKLLDESGIEQQEFAAAIGANPKIVSMWRGGKLHSYRKYLPQIADFLGTTVDYLLTGQKEKPAIVYDDGSSDDETLKIYEMLVAGLTDAGLIRPGEDITEKQAEALIGIVNILDAMFND